jgi:hypothetical protein
VSGVAPERNAVDGRGWALQVRHDLVGLLPQLVRVGPANVNRESDEGQSAHRHWNITFFTLLSIIGGTTEKGIAIHYANVVILHTKKHLMNKKIFAEYCRKVYTKKHSYFLMLY